MRVEYMSMAKGPEKSPPPASVPTPQLTILGLMVKLDAWLATEPPVYIPTPVPAIDSASCRGPASAGGGAAPAGPSTAAARARAPRSGTRRWGRPGRGKRRRGMAGIVVGLRAVVRSAAGP